jgi:uncharacterized membrane protein YobD (UPF0266 family)
MKLKIWLQVAALPEALGFGSSGFYFALITTRYIAIKRINLAVQISRKVY